MNVREWSSINAQLVLAAFPDKQVSFDDEEYTWLLIQAFDLPVGWNPNSSSLLLKLPGLDNCMQMPPDSFYLRRGLRHLNGSEPEHYYEGAFWNDLADKNYARLSLHLDDWKPSVDVISGDNWLTCIDLIYQGLKKLGE